MTRRRLLISLSSVIVLAFLAIIIFKMAFTGHSSSQRVIASVIPLTGPGAEFGGYNREACELFVEDYNRTHPGDRSIRHVFQDSRGTGKDGVSAMQAILATEQPVAVQAQLSAVAMSIAPISSAKRLVLFTIAGAGGPKTASAFAFRNYPAPEATARATVDAFLLSNKNSRVAMLTNNDDFGLAVGSAFKARLAEVGMALVAEDTFEKEGSDFRAQVTKLLAKSPDVVYVVGFGNPLGRIILQLRELGFKAQILGGPEIAFADVLTIANNAAEGVSFLDLAFDPDSQEEPTKSFVQRYKAKYNRTPSAVSAVVYDGWSIILAAIDKCGTTEPEKLTKTLLTLNDVSGVCGKLSVNTERDVIYPFTPRTILHGKPVRVAGPETTHVQD